MCLECTWIRKTTRFQCLKQFLLRLRWKLAGWIIMSAMHQVRNHWKTFILRSLQTKSATLFLCFEGGFYFIAFHSFPFSKIHWYITVPWSRKWEMWYRKLRERCISNKAFDVTIKIATAVWNVKTGPYVMKLWLVSIIGPANGFRHHFATLAKDSTIQLRRHHERSLAHWYTPIKIPTSPFAHSTGGDQSIRLRLVQSFLLRNITWTPPCMTPLFAIRLQPFCFVSRSRLHNAHPSLTHPSVSSVKNIYQQERTVRAAKHLLGATHLRARRPRNNTMREKKGIWNSVRGTQGTVGDEVLISLIDSIQSAELDPFHGDVR